MWFFEAGHAVVAHALGGRVLGISCVPSQGRYGYCTHDNCSSSEDNAAFFCAGRLAEERLIVISGGDLKAMDFMLGLHAFDDMLAGIEADRKDGLSPESRPERTRKAIEMVEDIFTKKWYAVERLANELLAHGTLNEIAAKSILEKSAIL